MPVFALREQMTSTTTRSEWLRKWCHQRLDFWASLHVEFQGCYSAQRLLQLQKYSADLSSLRLVLLCLLTPLPSLFPSLLSDAAPLPPMEAGVSRNWFVFVRSGALTGVIGASILVQIGQGVEQLKMRARQVVFVAILAATVSMAFVVLLCSLIIFPMPFGTLFAGPPCVFVIGAGVIYVSRPRLRADPSLWAELKRQLNVFYCQTALTFIYPFYIYGYTALTGMGQVAFALLSPVIHIIAKNWISRNFTDHDLKPVTVIFYAEVFNALYASSVLQSRSSWQTALVIMITDIMQFGLAMFDITKLMHEVKQLMRKIPREHLAARDNFLQIAERLVNIKTSVSLPHPKSNSSSTGGEFKSEASRGPRWTIAHNARVLPAHIPQHVRWVRHTFETDHKAYSNIALADAAATVNASLQNIFSREERELFIKKTSQVLFVTEYIMLEEYIEVAMPIIFNLHQLALFHMPNSAYYPPLTGLTSTQFSSRIYYRLAYAVFEFVSLILVISVLKWTLGFSSLRQLGFVLERHAGTIQLKLISVFVYIMQLSLKHVGADFSFKFSWLHPAKTG